MDAYLILENGKTFKGKAFGKIGETIGETVFATGITGYIETLTDKSYHGQIVVQTFPLIGNYGIIPSDFEGDIVGPCGYIVKEWCQDPSNFRSEGDLNTFLISKGIVGLYGIDTRALTKIVRENGVMNGKITTSLDNLERDIAELKAFTIKNAVENVTTKQAYTESPTEAFGGEIPERFHVALMDFGIKDNIKRELMRRGCKVTVLPGDTSFDEIMLLNPDGIMLSNGPGDPAENVEIIKNIAKVLEHNQNCHNNGDVKAQVPIFGICLGHQLLALANGFKTIKLKYGHRGGNQPVKDLIDGRVYITSQNHGYAVDRTSIDESRAREIFINVNDKTSEGLEYKTANAFSVQFHPEACGGPKDTSFLFDKFIDKLSN